MMNMELTAVAVLVAVLAAGAVSGMLYGRKRKWIDAALVLVASSSLAVALADIRLPQAGENIAKVTTDASGGIGEASLQAITRAQTIALSGDGLREAEWRDLPARRVQWTPGAADQLWLDFPRSISLGRIFTLTVRRAPAQAGWRLQLLAENKQVLADSNLSGASTSSLSVQWLPPVAEAMVLQARLLDAAGKAIAQGPIPLQVKEPMPLQIQGRFDAPSFDARALNQLLADGDAVLDWSVTLGKAVARSETARAPLTAPNAMFVDAAYVEHMNPSARGALLAQTRQGVPLVVLGANAADAAMWQREFGLRLHPQSPTTEKEDTRQFTVAGAVLAMPPAALNPDDNAVAPWSVAARDSRKQPWLWQRDLQQGRVVWIGVSDWHRYAINSPQALALWWQGAMDKIALAGVQKTIWRMPDPMPLQGLRSEVCVEGGAAASAQPADGGPALPLLARADKADSRCGAWWPRRAGWMRFDAAGMEAPALEYVYDVKDWPAWQRALRRDATTTYAARAARAGDVASAGRLLPIAPFALAFTLCMLGLWYRESRQRQ
ncbi:hypothetical protein D0T25_31820 [Duganella sp. BJB488]|uniref:hypothetical protein n=1 Tax=unclassified Duganella TaxID=2636909 RepID=UPI000E3442D4|nr:MULTISPECIES: hypothetical protein [unclassified Duganella]RFP11126.1 hypothetical protein D0T25_31820 [Duganella sp. BJB488]RFP24060.1 hypothetical protein D0T26_03245 [Duganella sp. BJB489]RFP34847.1 hypothetical protein D0T24_14825 [Duganella sp. BJB480]